MNRALAIFLLLLSLWPIASRTQQFQCPAGSQPVSGGGGMMCQCPDGSYAGLYSGCPSAPQYQQPQVGDVCANGDTCPVGSRCSWMAGRCTPNGMVDCGSYSCSPGQRCASGHNACLSQTDIDCGSYSCSGGSKCSSAGCIPQAAADCGNRTYCNDGLKCSRNGKSCLAQDAVDCGGHVCGAGMKCGTGSQCLARDAVDCGGGKSCPVGNVCLRGGAECVTPAQLAERVAAEKQRKIDEAAQRKREAEEKAAAIKAAKEKEAEERAAAAKAAAERKAAEQEAAKKDAEAKRESARLQKEARAAIARRSAQTAQRPGQKCEPAITIIDHIAAGIADDSPPCTGAASSQAKVATSAPATASKPVVLNPDLKDIATLSPGTPPSSGKTTGPASPTFQSTSKFNASAPVNPAQSKSFLNRLENATAFANTAVKDDPNFKAGKRGLEVTAAVSSIGCAAGALIGGGAGAVIGGLPAIPGGMAGCAVGAATANAVVGAAEFGYSIGTGISEIVEKKYTQGVSDTVTNVVAQVADQATDKIPISSSGQVAGSWGTYFLYGFYNNVPGN